MLSIVKRKEEGRERIFLCWQFPYLLKLVTQCTRTKLYLNIIGDTDDKQGFVSVCDGRSEMRQFRVFLRSFVHGCPGIIFAQLDFDRNFRGKFRISGTNGIRLGHAHIVLEIPGWEHGHAHLRKKARKCVGFVNDVSVSANRHIGLKIYGFLRPYFCTHFLPFVREMILLAVRKTYFRYCCCIAW